MISLHSDDSVLGKNSDGEYREYSDGTREIAVVANNDQLPFVLAHEYGHMLMEDHFADDQNRARVFEEVVAEVRKHLDKMSFLLKSCGHTICCHKSLRRRGLQEVRGWTRISHSIQGIRRDERRAEG